jgi:hypothetical protein
MNLEPDPKICSKAKYNVLTIKGKNVKVVNKWPELKKFPEFTRDYGNLKGTNLNTESILRYCLLFYQKNTLRNYIPSFQQQKTQMAIWAGFELDNKTKQFTDRLEQVLLGNNEDVNKLIARVKQLTDDVLYQQFITYESVRARQMLLLESGNESKTKIALEVLETVSDGIRRLEEEMLKEDVHTPIKDALYHSVVLATLPRPETIAQSKKDGTIDEIINEKPYEVDYPGALKYGKTKSLR